MIFADNNPKHLIARLAQAEALIPNRLDLTCFPDDLADQIAQRLQAVNNGLFRVRESIKLHLADTEAEKEVAMGTCPT